MRSTRFVSSAKRLETLANGALAKRDVCEMTGHHCESPWAMSRQTLPSNIHTFNSSAEARPVSLLSKSI